MNERSPDAPDAPPAPSEQRQADRLAAHVDGLLNDVPSPPAMSADARLLLEAATALRAGAATTPDALAPARVRSLVDDALRDAAAGPRVEQAGEDAPAERTPRPVAAKVVWLGAALAAAAALVLALRPAASPSIHAPAPRTTDALVGAIAPDRASAARPRIDLLYADRLQRYRAAHLFAEANVP